MANAPPEPGKPTVRRERKDDMAKSDSHIEMVSDLTPEQLREATEPKPVLVGNEEEIENIKRVFDTEVLPSDDHEIPASEPAERPAVTPSKPIKAEEPPAEQFVDVDGQQVPLSEVRNRYRFWSATNQRAAQVAAERRRLEEEKAGFERGVKADLALLKERIPPLPPLSPEPIKLDLSDVPDVDNTTLEGQEKMKDWVVQVATKAATAAREEALAQTRKLPEPSPASSEPQPPASSVDPDPVLTYNAAIGGQFRSPDVLALLGIDEAKAQAYLEHIDQKFTPTSPDGRWTLGEVQVLARRFQDMEREDQARAAQAAQQRKADTIKKAADASDVVRGGGSPAGRSLRISDVLSMSEEDKRRKIVGPMKGRGGPAAYGTGPLYKTWEELENITT